MSKYYKQVGILQDWMHSAQSKVIDSFKMTESLSVYFCHEHSVNIFNQISEAMTHSLEGRQLNNFLEFMRERQDQIGKKKLSTLNNTFKDRLFISTRYLGQSRPFWPLPGKIPEDQLPPEFSEIMATLTKTMQEMQDKERRRQKKEHEEQRARLLESTSN